MNSVDSKIPNSVNLGNFVCIQKKVKIGERTRICNFSNLYGCTIGEDCMIGSYTEIQSDVIIGSKTRIQSHSFICSGTRIGENCFLAHNIMTVNDKFSNGQVNYEKEDWGKLVIGNDVIVGSGAILFPVRIGQGAIIGSGAIVTQDVAPYTTVVGIPAREITRKNYRLKITENSTSSHGYTVR